jgi:hypothetical protein
MLGDGYGIYANKPVMGSIQTTAVKLEGSMTGKIFKEASSFNIRNISSADNQRPVANAGIDMTLRKGITSVQLNGTASSDPEGKQMYYEWIQVDGDPVNIDDPNAVKPLVTGLESNETYIFRLMVHDGILSDADVVVVGPKIPVTIKENKLWILWIVMGAGLFFFFIFLKRKKGKVRV